MYHAKSRRDPFGTHPQKNEKFKNSWRTSLGIPVQVVFSISLQRLPSDKQLFSPSSDDADSCLSVCFFFWSIAAGFDMTREDQKLSGVLHDTSFLGHFLRVKWDFLKRDPLWWKGRVCKISHLALQKWRHSEDLPWSKSSWRQLLSRRIAEKESCIRDYLPSTELKIFI